MNDYFFEMCDTRAELAASRVTIQNLIRAIEIDSPILKLANLKLAKEQIASIDTVLTKEAE